MRKSTKLAGLVAGAASLVGGFAIAAAPQAQASAPVSVYSCNGVHGTNPTDTTLGGGAVFYNAVTGLPDTITNVPKPLKIKVKADKVSKAPAPGYSTTAGKCVSGSVSVGDVKGFSGSLKGSISCDTSAAYPTAVAPVGTQTVTFTSGVDPVTGLPAKSSMSVTITKPSSLPLLDSVKIHGIVTKGIIPGADVSGVILQQPIAPTAQSPTGSSPWWDATEGTPGVPNGNTLTADNASLNAGIACITGAGGLPNVAFATDGTSLTAAPLHNSFQVTTED